MSQHDYIISNASGATVRADINSVLAAIITNNSGATAPSTTYSYQFWADTTTGILKQRNAANSAWIDIGTMASTNLGLLSLAGGTMTGAILAAVGAVGTPSYSFTGDPDTGVYHPAANQLGLVAGGTEYINLSSLGANFLGTGQLKLPVGTTAQRTGSPAQGMARFNSTLGCEEIYNGTAWISTGTLSGSAKAWVNFNGTGTVAIRTSYNVSSITDLGTGSYQVNFTNAMPTADYVVTATKRDQVTNLSGHCDIGAYATTSINIVSIEGASAVATDSTVVNVVIHSN